MHEGTKEKKNNLLLLIDHLSSRARRWFRAEFTASQEEEVTSKLGAGKKSRERIPEWRDADQLQHGMQNRPSRPCVFISPVALSVCLEAAIALCSDAAADPEFLFFPSSFSFLPSLPCQPCMQ